MIIGNPMHNSPPTGCHMHLALAVALAVLVHVKVTATLGMQAMENARHTRDTIATGAAPISLEVSVRIKCALSVAAALRHLRHRHLRRHRQGQRSSSNVFQETILGGMAMPGSNLREAPARKILRSCTRSPLLCFPVQIGMAS